MQVDTRVTQPILNFGDFEGPIELLLRLIQERKFPINDISLAQITDEYIAYIRTISQNNYSYITHFLYVASTLLLIKSRSLLPSIELTEEEEESIEELELRLKIFALFRDRAEQLRERTEGHRMFTRPFKMRRVVVFSPDTRHMTIPLLRGALDDVLKEAPVVERLPEVRVRTAVHINEMIDRLQARIQQALDRISFTEVTRAPLADASPYEQKVYTVVGFLALLEMVRNGLAEVEQMTHFDDIMIMRRKD